MCDAGSPVDAISMKPMSTVSVEVRGIGKWDRSRMDGQCVNPHILIYRGSGESCMNGEGTPQVLTDGRFT